jgi:diguanylate cyclase
VPSINTDNGYDQSVDIVRHAIPRMSELKIPITPTNYAVWYAYLAKSNQALREEMDALLGRDQPITNREMHALYERFLEERSEKVQIAKTALRQVVNALMQHISHADGQYSYFSSELNDIAGELATDTDAGDLNVLIERAVRATNKALASGAELKQRFSELAHEMQQVRGELARSQEEARVDALTGLYNRLALQEELAGLSVGLDEDTHAPCMLLIDVDFFKRINDSYGHLAGDHVLRHVAREIKASVRGRDIVARYGGEEYAVLLRDTPRSGCSAVAENVRATIERGEIHLPPEFGSEQALSVTVSIGVAWLREQEPIEAFVARADRALYASKEAGRNCVSWEGRRPES